jgi:hypothetical protein
MPEEPSKEAVAEEAGRARLLRMIVDLTANVLMQQPLSWNEAQALVAATRSRALELFPDKAATYDLILKPRFDRILQERFGILPFRPRT